MKGDLIGQAMQIVLGSENKKALRELKLFLTDCAEAGFEQSEIDNIRITMLWVLLQQRLDPNFMKME